MSSAEIDESTLDQDDNNNNNNNNNEIDEEIEESQKKQKNKDQNDDNTSNNQDSNNNNNNNEENNTESNSHKDLQKNMRTIGRWYIGETLGKGGYSWVKKGFDKKTGKCVALKFMAKADKSWSQEQSKQVITEIESLKQIRHSNVMKLYAYNLNAKYPTKDKDKVDVILLVLEYAPGGELFDILYYTSALETIIARTYFRQIISAIEACHNAGVAHRDIKPQNLLLDSKFNLKLTDFGLSKLFNSDSDSVMKTTYVGTKGYQAPELLLDKPYDLSCDIFSVGVVLFIILTGYPPFEQAHASDRWFKPLAKGDYEKFWKAHRGCAIANDAKAKDLLQRMLSFDPSKRISIADIKKHPWYLDKILEGKDLVRALRNRHKDMESKRRKDARKVKDLQQSIQINRDLPCPVCTTKNRCQCFSIQLFPENEVESITDTHTTADWKDIVNAITQSIGQNGHVQLEPKECKLVCSLKTALSDLHTDAKLINFEVQIFQSREYVKPVSNKLASNDESNNNNNNDEDEDDEDRKNDNEVIHVVRLRRLEGDIMEFRKVKKYIFESCAEVLTGLPKWALKLQEQKQLQNNDNNNDNDNDDDDENDNYDQLLRDDSSFANNNLLVSA